MSLSDRANDENESALSKGLYVISGISGLVGFGSIFSIPSASEHNIPYVAGFIAGCYAVSIASFFAGDYIKKHF